MNSPSNFARIVAVCCSVVLVGGYLFYRAGGSLPPGSKSGRVSPVASDSSADAAPDKPVVVMPGSKSAAPFSTAERLDARAERPATLPAEEFRVMSGSKSAAHVIEPSDAKALYGDPSSPQPATQPR